MKCLYPHHSQRQIGGVVRSFARRCGQCMNCRITKAQEKAARIRLEALRYPAEQSWFVTLTYSDEAVPLTPTGQPTVRHADWIAFRLALNARLRALGIRDWSWAAVLEYGDRTRRPHVHVVLFGVDPAAVRYVERREAWRVEYAAQQRRLSKRGRQVPESLQPLHQLLLAAWRYRGHVLVLPYEGGAASYVSHYLTKAMTKGRLAEGDDREPERFSWSLGHGSHVVSDFAERYRRARLYFHDHPAHAREGWRAVAQPKLYRLGGTLYPLDGYMRGKLVDALGGDSRSEDERWAFIEAEYLSQFAEADEGLCVVDLAAGGDEEVQLEQLRARGLRRWNKAKAARSL